jgi:diguanylate cyclase (GGDEF)-like protein/PAS domain S-box-containing protein
VTDDTLGLVARVRRLLPAGMALPEEAWKRRHRWIVTLVWVHAVGLTLFGMVRGLGVLHSFGEGAALAAAAIAASSPILTRRTRSAVAALGLVGSSAVFVHMSGGVTEVHFHFFVVIGLLSLYQEWTPFLVAIGFVVLHHGVLGALSPESVYNHQDAVDHPWTWALIHGSFVLAASVANLVAWRLNEEAGMAAAASELRFRKMVETAQEGVWVFDDDDHTIFVNQKMATMLGVTTDDMMGRSMIDFMPELERQGVAAHLKSSQSSGIEQAELQFQMAGGELIWALVSTNPVPDGTLAMVSDITERKAAEAALAYQAFHDSVTGLPNRALFLDRLGLAMAKSSRHHQMTAVLFLDLDRFKWVNDSLGHAAGDTLLVAAAARLRGALRPGDTMARFGGDEFAVLCEEIDDVSDGMTIAQRLAAALASPFTIEERPVNVSASIGLALAHADIEPEALIRDADAAMYMAKERGRDRIEVFDDEMRASAMSRLETESALRSALDNNELRVHFQPIVGLGGHEVVGVEALVRWQHPELGLVPPLDFIPLAEDTGLIVPIGTFVLGEACRTVAQWNRAHPDRRPLDVSVNLSARQLASPGLPDVVERVLVESGLPAGLLCLEITESVLMSDADTTSELLSSLKRLGVTIAVDDFGTGYSSLLYLRRFPVDVLKIDRSFVAGLGETNEDNAIVQGVIGLARALGLRSVAEGVEEQGQATELDALGCDLAQGFLWSKPLDRANLEEWLELSVPAAPAAIDAR